MVKNNTKYWHLNNNKKVWRFIIILFVPLWIIFMHNVTRKFVVTLFQSKSSGSPVNVIYHIRFVFWIYNVKRTYYTKKKDLKVKVSINLAMILYNKVQQLFLKYCIKKQLNMKWKIIQEAFFCFITTHNIKQQQ